MRWLAAVATLACAAPCSAQTRPDAKRVAVQEAERLSAETSSNPDVCEPSWRIVIFDLRGSCLHSGTYSATASSSAMRWSVKAIPSESPPTSAFAIDAV